jgi:hypothetical protein
MTGAGITEALVRKKLQELLTICEQQRRRPSVLALARQLGMSNTTFRRHYPEIVCEISGHRSLPANPVSSTRSEYDRLVARNAKLRRSNRGLTSQLKLAVAQVQYLALRNAGLQEAVETAAKVTHLGDRRPRS